MQTKIAVVTGASGGIGAQICRALAQAGVALVTLDRRPDPAPAVAPAAALSVDLADHTSIAHAAGDILARFERIDYLFNNAGVLTERMERSRYGNELHFEVNALAPLALTDRLRPALRAARTACVVNTTAGISLGVKSLDVATLVRPPAFSKLFGPYNASKAALNVLTSELARDYAPDGIIVRAADPGPTKTRLTKGAGTPLWMRAFYPLLPSPLAGAKHIVDAALSDRWERQSGIVLSGGRIRTLAPALADRAFEERFLAACRTLAAAR